MHPHAFIKTIKPVSNLRQIARLAENGSLKVAKRSLGEGVKAQYIHTEGAYQAEPNLSDTILLSDSIDWSNQNLLNRSILVHEAYHAKDDLELAGQEMGQIASEKRAWTGQGAYLVEELSRSETPELEVDALIENLQALDELSRFCLSLAIANAQVVPACKPQVELLNKRINSTIKKLDNIEPMYENPGSSLEGLLGWIYAGSRNSKFRLDGIRQAGQESV